MPYKNQSKSNVHFCFLLVVSHSRHGDEILRGNIHFYLFILFKLQRGYVFIPIGDFHTRDYFSVSANSVIEKVSISAVAHNYAHILTLIICDPCPVQSDTRNIDTSLSMSIRSSSTGAAWLLSLSTAIGMSLSINDQSTMQSHHDVDLFVQVLARGT